MCKKISLAERDIVQVRKLARDTRFALGFSEDPPIANDLFTILESLGIILIGYPIESTTDDPAFSAVILCSEEGGISLVFIGLNTADYFDNQMFAIAHELYHYYTKTGSHLSRQEGQERERMVIEAMANRFAAEFLLPRDVLKRRILEEFSTCSLSQIETKVILRCIARIHCTWWLPYKSIVKRLREIGSIDESQYEELYAVDERDPHGEYYRIGQSFQKEVFVQLNTATKTISTSPGSIETIIRNFEEGLMDEDMFIRTLGLFDKTPSDYGYDIMISQDDIDEIQDFIEG